MTWVKTRGTGSHWGGGSEDSYSDEEEDEEEEEDESCSYSSSSELQDDSKAVAIIKSVGELSVPEKYKSTHQIRVGDQSEDWLFFVCTQL